MCGGPVAADPATGAGGGVVVEDEDGRICVNAVKCMGDWDKVLWGDELGVELLWVRCILCRLKLRLLNDELLLLLRPWLCELFRVMGESELLVSVGDIGSCCSIELEPGDKGGGGVADGVSVSTLTRGDSLPSEDLPPTEDIDCMEAVGEGDE